MQAVSRLIRELPVRKKLMLAIVGIGIFVLVFTSAIMTFTAVQDKKQSIVDSLSLTATIIGDNSVMPLVNSEPDLVSEKFLGLLSDESIRKSCAYDQNFELFAEYSIYWEGKEGCPKTFDLGLVSEPHKTLALNKEFLKSLREPIHTFSSDHLKVMSPVVTGGEVIGLMYLVSDLSKVNNLVAQEAYSTLVIILVTTVLIIFLTIWLQKLIAGPIVRFARIIKNISKTNNYSARVRIEANDEFGVLANSFNHMLDVIQSREKALKDSEKSALMAKKEAERANAVKSEFLSNMSHELRTPMNSIMGVADILVADKNLSKEHMELIEMIYGSSSNMLEIINETLDMAQLGAKAITLNESLFDVEDVTDNVRQSLSSLANEKRLEFGWNNKSLIGLSFVGDSKRLNQILTNVIGNALKFTQAGSVNVTFGSEAVDSREHHFLCKVSDTGVGIPEGKLDYIFERFTQVDETINRKFGGTGLGLAVSKEIIELMGGKISVTSKLGEGSCFTLSIPFKLSNSDKSIEESPGHTGENLSGDQQQASQQEELIPVEKVRVLVAEDDKFNQKFIERLLQRLNVKSYDIADNGQIAVDLWKKNTYDVIFMDCHMPEKNGYEATREIRALEQEMGKKPVPIVSVTADVTENVQEECKEAGMDEYISKPVVEDVLRKAASRWFVLQEKPS